MPDLRLTTGGRRRSERPPGHTVVEMNHAASKPGARPTARAQRAPRRTVPAFRVAGDPSRRTSGAWPSSRPYGSVSG
ncbi:hypothetical protein I547_3550 [Mycobacterium kansasii 824]|uniref:Uncharacterized protein n=1 Tax=Mycobacterium kansasii TaxID=1768 RepID=A0A1V3XMY5_MYCKA|nr:hypothetical protein I547_3550 [Mycobacterium kansasii 824]KEP39812.1 hypothetical protein MKSMC1_50550 [Mycobacterium kansasii]OOK80583.1 hypothetical protein BZL29_2582 [Mycobacterium kansasii]